MTRAPILSREFVWHSASSHSDPSKFAARMAERLRKAQTRPAASITPIKAKSKDSK